MLICGTRCAPGPTGSNLVRQPLLGDTFRQDCPDAQLSCGGAQFGRGYNLLVLHPSQREYILPALCCAVLWFESVLLQNQHDLSQLAGGLRQTPFWLAIQLPSCVGVVQTMDSECTPPRRIWCVLEVCIRCTLAVSVIEPDLHRVLWQINIATMIEKKDFEVAAMIEEGTQEFKQGGVIKPIPAGPALRDASGQEHVKSEGGLFPTHIAEAGLLVRVQDAQASRDGDRVTILNHIVQSDDPSGEPLPEHPNYEEMNRAVQGLFLGPALISYAALGSTQQLRKLLSNGTEQIDYQSSGGQTSAYISAAHGQTQSLKVLAEMMADLNQATKDGATPALVSAQEGHVGALQVLIDAAVDVNTTMTVDSCHSPLTIAALMGQMSVYELLLANGADTAYKALPKLEEPFKTAGGTAEQILQERAHKTE